MGSDLPGSMGGEPWGAGSARGSGLRPSLALMAWLLTVPACDRTVQVSESPDRLLQEAAGVPSQAFLAFTHAGWPDTVRAGGTAGVVEETVEVILDVGGRTDDLAIRSHLSVEPSNVLDGEVRWSEYQNKALFRLHRLAPGRDVLVRLRAGLPRDGAEPLPHDQLWRLRREDGTTVQLTLAGDGVLIYEDGRYSSPDGPVGGAEPTVFVPRDSIDLELHFSRPMRREQVEHRLREELADSRAIDFEWRSPDRLRLRVTFPEPVGRTAPVWDSYHLDLRGLLDDRGLPILDPRLARLEVGRASVINGWTPADGVEHLGDAPPRLLVFSHRGTISGDGILAWHFEEEFGDYWEVAPWLVKPGPGEPRRLGGSVAAFEALSMEWLPAGGVAVIGQTDAVGIVRAEEGVADRLAMEDSLSLLQLTVNPVDGRLAVVTVPRLSTGDEVVASLLVLEPDGRLIGRVSGVGTLGFPEASPESLWPTWLPDGRVAILHRPRGVWLDLEPAARTVALVDPLTGGVSPTEVTANAIRGSSPTGELLLDGNRLFDPGTGEVRVIAVPRSGVELQAVSPDGERIAGIASATGEIGVWSRADARWMAIGSGTLLGWSPDGRLHWLGVDDQ